MISISTAVTLIVYLLIGGIVFGLFYWLIVYCEGEFPQVPMFFKIARIMLVFLAVLVVVGILLGVVGGRQIFVT